MLNISTGNQIIFNSKQNQHLQAKLTLNNTANKNYIIFKIKSTNPDIFRVYPLKGIIGPKQSKQLNIETNLMMNNQQAKSLALKHKFLVEFVIQNQCPNKCDEIINSFKNITTQNIKLYINTDNIRGSKLKGRSHSQLSNRKSFRTVHNFEVGPDNRSQSSLKHQTQAQKLDRLNEQINHLQKQHSKLLIAGKKKSKGNNYLKSIIFFIVALLIGYFISKYIWQLPWFSMNKNEQNQSIFNYFSSFWASPVQQQGWF